MFNVRKKVKQWTTKPYGKAYNGCQHVLEMVGEVLKMKILSLRTNNGRTLNLKSNKLKEILKEDIA